MEEKMMAGFARLDITPPLGVRIVGYYSVRIGEAVLDPLYINAIALKKGESTAVIVVCDLLSIVGDMAYHLPDLVAESLGIDVEGVFICHTHTHTGPVVDSYREPADPLYTEWFRRRLCDAAKLAVADLKEVREIRGNEKSVPGMTFSRRFRMPDGSVAKPDYNTPEAKPLGRVDDSMRVIRILREEGKEIVLINFQTHPDNLGGNKYSADFPGALRDAFEKERDVFCAFFNGAEGNLVTMDRRVPRTLNGYGDVRKYGERLAAAAVALYDEAEPVPGAGLKFTRKIVKGKTKLDPALMPEAYRVIELFNSGRKKEIHPNGFVMSGIAAEALHLKYLEEHDLPYIDIRLTAVAFGGIIFVGIPGEPFSETGLDVRAASPYAYTCICCHTNGTEGYYPTAEAFEEGGYEPKNTRFAKGIAEMITEECIKLVKEVHEA